MKSWCVGWLREYRGEGKRIKNGQSIELSGIAITFHETCVHKLNWLYIGVINTSKIPRTIDKKMLMIREQTLTKNHFTIVINNLTSFQK